MNKAEIAIRLLQLPKVGRKTGFALIRELDFIPTSDADLADFVKGISNKLRLPSYTQSEFSKAFSQASDILERTFQNDIQVLSYFDEGYPQLLKATDDAPLILNYKGDIDSLNTMICVAIIGTREPSEHGSQVGKRLGTMFGSKGFNVVSGLAIGCDTSGHRGCLDANGITTAVLAHGLDTIYPKENRSLAEMILEKRGLLLSEYVVGTKPLGNFFVERDRIQAGLSSCIIVVETDIKGGTMHTVKFAQKAGRLLAAYQHKPEYLIGNTKASGNQMLIREGSARPLGNQVDIDELIEKLTKKESLKPSPAPKIESEKKKENPTIKAAPKKKATKQPDPQIKIKFDEGDNT